MLTARSDIFINAYFEIHERVYDFRTVKPLPSDWTEENVVLTPDVSRYKGPFKYSISPYTREIIDCFAPTSPVTDVAIMKCAQSGLTQGFIIPFICYTIAENPGPMLYTAADGELAKSSVNTRLDPVIESAGIAHLIRPNVIRKRNQRTGDTSKSKEFAGGKLIVMGTKNADKFRQESIKFILADDWEAAPRNDKDEGSVQRLLEGRTTSFGSTAKKAWVSTPAVKQTSNIEPIYLKGDQRKWHWCCPNCEGWIPMEWRVERSDGTFGGIKYKLSESGELMESSVHYECQLCKGRIDYKQKHSLNQNGKWIPTAKPYRRGMRSYYINALIIPVGFTSWIDLVYEWIEANPAPDRVDIGKLQTFLNIRLGQTWEEKGETPRVNELMKNTCGYLPGFVPDTTCENQGNGKILMLTLACDLNGIMERNNEDVRLDWELVAHTESGATYSVDHGSIGTFKRERDKTEYERRTDAERDRFTYSHGHYNSVWPLFEELMRKEWPKESGEGFMKPLLTLVDTGYFTKSAFQFIDGINDLYIFGIKGLGDDLTTKKIKTDAPMVKQSREKKKLYLLDVNSLKDEVSENIKLHEGNDGYQPPGFMNFPQPQDGKYTMTSFFQHFEGEQRVEETKAGVPIGFIWKKKNNQSLNHFWDVRIYNHAGRYIWLDLFVKSEKNIRSITWAEYVELLK